MHIKLSHSALSALKATIDHMIALVDEGGKQLESILQNTIQQMTHLKWELTEFEQACRDVAVEIDSLGEPPRPHEWPEQAVQLGVLQQGLANQLQGFRETVGQTEIVLHQFAQIKSDLQFQFRDLFAALNTTHEQASLGLQMLKVQEEEKRVYAYRLHDGPMQSLASVAMLMQMPDYVLSSGDYVQGIRDRLNDILGDLRQVVFDLRPPLLDDLGLVPTLKRYVQQWEDGVEVTVQINLLGVERVFHPSEKVTLFRGVQEALTNVLKHSKATEVDITLLYGPESVRVCVSDNGIGIQAVDWQNWLDSGKLGLALCRQRMRMLGGTLDIHRRDPNGTELIMELPTLRGSQRDTG